MSLFKWETLKEIRTEVFRFKSRTVPGKIFEVELTSDQTVQVWRSDNGQDYFCHGLTFGGKEAPGGLVSLLGDFVPTMLHGHYDLIPESQAMPGDILVWRGGNANDVVHSAVLIEPVITPGQRYLDYASRLQSKNGITPEADMSLGELIEAEDGYGESYNVYRRK